MTPGQTHPGEHAAPPARRAQQSQPQHSGSAENVTPR